MKRKSFGIRVKYIPTRIPIIQIADTLDLTAWNMFVLDEVFDSPMALLRDCIITICGIQSVVYTFKIVVSITICGIQSIHTLEFRSNFEHCSLFEY